MKEGEGEIRESCDRWTEGGKRRRTLGCAGRSQVTILWLCTHSATRSKKNHFVETENTHEIFNFPS